jgi:hypothetical protein
MDKKIYLGLLGLVVCLTFFPDMAFATTKTFSFANGESLKKVYALADEMKDFIFSFPVYVGEVIAFGMAAYHSCFTQGGPVPLCLTTITVILVNMVPLLIDILNPMTASGMILPW